MHRNAWPIVAVAVLCTSAAWCDEPAAPAGDPERDIFERQVVPILVRNCVRCHNGSEANGELNLTTRETALKGGENGSTMVPGDPASSYLIEMVGTHQMPPGPRPP